ncbi:MAG: hypothetical protein ACLFV4_11465, partial [Candidatus Hydrogenedentota bacterium]
DVPGVSVFSRSPDTAVRGVVTSPGPSGHPVSKGEFCAELAGEKEGINRDGVPWSCVLTRRLGWKLFIELRRITLYAGGVLE